MPSVSVVRTKDYSTQELKRAIDSHFDNLPLAQGLTPESKVLIKPNLLTNKNPADAVTTSPQLIGVVIQKLKELGVEDITIADSPSGPFTVQRLKKVYTVTGMEQLAREYNVKLGYDVDFTSVENPEGKICRSFEIIPAVTNADFIINMAKLKSHGMTMLSAGVKNLFGCVPGLLKPELHFRYPEKEHFAQMLVDLSLLVKPQVTIVDAVEAMEGDGPNSGDKRYVGLTFASKYLYDLDLLLCHFTGFQPKEVPTITAAMARGLCCQRAEHIEIVGDSIEPLTDFKRPKTSSVDFVQKIPGPIRKPFEVLSDKLIKPRPVIAKKRCIGCGKCAESCPPHTISMENKKAVIAYDKCIKCYCCHEMCPVKAIDIKRLSLLRI